MTGALGSPSTPGEARRGGPPRRVLLGNQGATFALDDRTDGARLSVWLEAVLAPHFAPRADQTPDFTVVLREFGELPGAWHGPGPAAGDEAVILRRSPFPLFDLRGRRRRLPDGSSLVLDATTGTAYRHDAAGTVVEFFGSEAEPSRVHLLEYLRTAALLVEEARGTLILHAAATITGGRAYLILGPKGAGKSTTMLHLVLEHGHEYLSGDRVLVSRGPRGLRVRGWPDYPCLGLATLRRFTGFAATCGIADNDPPAPSEADGKVLLSPGRFRAALPRPMRAECDDVAMLLLPQVSSRGTSWRRSEARGPVAACVEHPHQFEAARWHDLLASRRARSATADEGLLAELARRPTFVIAGEGVLPAALLANQDGGR
jgi:hypothetical protein